MSIQGRKRLFLADCRITLLYEDLKVSLLKKYKGAGRFDKKGLASLFINVFIKSSNNAEDPRTERGHFQRIRNMLFFNLIWRTLFTGIKQSVGLE